MDLRASLKQLVIYNARGWHQYSRNKLVVVNGRSIMPNSNQKEVLHLPVPLTALLTSKSCELIEIKYEIIVTLVITNHFDLHCILPVILTWQIAY